MRAGRPMPGPKSICRASGSIDFDPARGSVAKSGLVTVAVVRDARHGTFIWFPSG
jgi:hypothetical protein